MLKLKLQYFGHLMQRVDSLEKTVMLVKETGAADHTVRNAVALQGKFQGVGLGVGPVQNGMVLKTASLGIGDDPSGHIIGFGALVGGFVNGDQVALTVGSPEFLSLAAKIMGNHFVGCIQDGLGGAVILLQTDDPAAFILFFEAENVLNGGTPDLTC